MTKVATTKKFQASTLLNYSPRKARLVINQIRGLSLDKALSMLPNINKKVNKKVYDLLKSAASNLNLTESDFSTYKVSSIMAEEAQTLSRVMPRARGSAFKVRRRYSRIKVELAKNS